MSAPYPVGCPCCTYQPKPLTEARVREIVREELAKVTFTVTHDGAADAIRKALESYYDGNRSIRSFTRNT